MFRAKIYIDLHERGILSEVTEVGDGPFRVYEEHVHDDETVTFRIDAGDLQQQFFRRLEASEEVVEVSQINDSNLLIRKQAMGALPIINSNHGKMDGIDYVYGTKRILAIVVFRMEDLRSVMTKLRTIGDVTLGKLLPIDDPSSQLTERQQTVIRLALERGYFEWPRSVDARALAAELEVSHSTFLEHLRKAERKLLEGAFSTEGNTATPEELDFLLAPRQSAD